LSQDAVVFPSTGATGTFFITLAFSILFLALFILNIFFEGFVLVAGAEEGGVVTVLSTTLLTTLGRSAKTREFVATTEAEGDGAGASMSFGPFGFTSTTTGAAFGDATGK
jgi:hypothetical protein